MRKTWHIHLHLFCIILSLAFVEGCDEDIKNSLGKAKGQLSSLRKNVELLDIFHKDKNQPFK
jgi:hypothetical protein